MWIVFLLVGFALYLAYTSCEEVEPLSLFKKPAFNQNSRTKEDDVDRRGMYNPFKA